MIACDVLCCVGLWYVVFKCCSMCFSVPCQAARSRSEWAYYLPPKPSSVHQLLPVAVHTHFASCSTRRPLAMDLTLSGQPTLKGFEKKTQAINLISEIIARMMKFNSNNFLDISRVKLTCTCTRAHVQVSVRICNLKLGIYVLSLHV